MENENIERDTTEQEIKQEIDSIKKRNKRVETDKARETSTTRRIIIAILTYIIVVIYSLLIKKTSNIFLTSLVPVIGFLLSTVSLKLSRKFREKKLWK